MEDFFADMLERHEALISMLSEGSVSPRVIAEYDKATRADLLKLSAEYMRDVATREQSANDSFISQLTAAGNR